MSQDIADMPGIEAAVERFNAMESPAGTGTETVPSLAGGGSATCEQPAIRGNITATRESGPPKGGTPNRADAQPAANGGAQNSVSPTNGARAATDTIKTVTGAAGNSDSNQQSSSVPRRGTTEDRFAANGAEKREGGEKDQSLLTSAATQEKSRYAKGQERLEKTWESVNKRKTDLDAQAQQLEQQRLNLERDRAQFEAIRRQAEQPQATPEQAVQAAQARRRDADALRMQARRAEEAGRLDEVQRLNKQADKAESLADELGSYAEQLRKNPPVSMQQRQQQFEEARKHWTVEACNAFPDLAKNGSRLQQVVAQHLNALAKQDPQLLVHPSLIYHVARLADAQTKVADLETVAARVPVLEKEAESLRARIKELEAETTPAGGGGVARLSDSAQDDYASLRQSAAELGHGRW